MQFLDKEMKMSETVEFSRLVREVFAWSTENFGPQPSYRAVLWLSELLGELSDAISSIDRVKIDD